MDCENIVTQLSESLVPVSKLSDRLPDESLDWARSLDGDYAKFLERCDGGYTSNNLYHFFGLSGPVNHHARSWNQPEPWKASYGLGANHFVFAENVLGNQYYFHHSPRRKVLKVLCVDNGQFLACADSFCAFVESIVYGDPFNEKIVRFLEEFLAFSKLSYQPFQHLAAKTPICMGGGDNLENLELIDSATNLSITGQLLAQIKK